jgi:hypothetical protein
MKQRGLLALVALAGLSLAVCAGAQLPPKPETIVKLHATPTELELARGGNAGVVLLATIEKGFHINSNKPSEDYLIPTRVELPADAPVVLAGADFPPGELKSFGFAPDEKLSVYEGTVKVSVKLKAKADAAAGEHKLNLAFHYQACNDQLCLRPAKREVALIVRVR